MLSNIKTFIAVGHTSTRFWLKPWISSSCVWRSCFVFVMWYIFSLAPISFRKKDKQEKDREDGAQDRFQAMQGWLILPYIKNGEWGRQKWITPAWNRNSLKIQIIRALWFILGINIQMHGNHINNVIQLCRLYLWFQSAFAL